jgi:hypothetical protein
MTSKKFLPPQNLEILAFGATPGLGGKLWRIVVAPSALHFIRLNRLAMTSKNFKKFLPATEFHEILAFGATPGLGGQLWRIVVAPSALRALGDTPSQTPKPITQLRARGLRA